MNFDLTEEQQVLQKTVRDFCARQIIPNARRWDEEEHFPSEVIPAMGELGLFGMQVPERYGGPGMKFHDYVVALEEVARADGSVGLTMASHNSLCTGHILLAANEAQKRKYLPQLATGKVLGAWGLTEPGSGSDAGSAETRAVRREGRGPDGSPRTEWLLHGTKTFITQGSVAGIYVVLASTSPEKKAKGLTAFIVEKGTPGFRSGRRLEKMGLHASDTTELILEEVVLPDEQRLGEIDHGFFDTLTVLDRGRIGIGAWAIGIGRGALEEARAYSRQRVQFGKPIAEFQACQTHAGRHGHRARGRPPAGLASGLDAGSRSEDHPRVLGGQVLRRPGGGAGLQRGRADPRRLRVHPRVPGGTVSARRQAGGDRGRDQRSTEDGDRPRAVQGLRVTEGPALSERIRAGDVRAAARLMREIDDGRPQAEATLRALYPHTGGAFVLGVTGPPGAGKSTLVDTLIKLHRQAGERVGVVAIDPSSAITGGAILGDRIRMQRHALDEQVFIRSLATRGQLGGLSRAAADVVTVLDALGCATIMVETVGVGQDEVDVAMLADTVLVVLVPGLGDEVQALKAGLIEAADLFVINKADREGADRAARDLATMLALREGSSDHREILKAVASTGQGVPDLAAAIARHRKAQKDSGALVERRRRQAETRLRAILLDRLRRRTEATLAGLGGGLSALADEVASRRLDPYTAVNRLLPEG